ncbi:hypothetical protein EYF80_021722 [Liparis tanakae]|uniref:Uncharacterized protein n=1 Tax=Liparis tanakae TaxID=230148 RepID=A0A4Z2HQT1_9TELE|nr:hypothetical protein EYF80_021722 [Liparis tanakae]
MLNTQYQKADAHKHPGHSRIRGYGVRAGSCTGVRRGVVRTLRGSEIQCVCHSECCGCALGFLGPGLIHLHIAPLQRGCCAETRRRSVPVPSLLAQPLAPSQGGERRGAGLARCPQSTHTGPVMRWFSLPPKESP